MSLTAPRRRVRHPRRRQRSRLPASRERDRAGGRRRSRVRALLAAQRHVERRRREDVEVARQLRDARRRPRPLRPARVPAARAADALPAADGSRATRSSPTRRRRSDASTRWPAGPQAVGLAPAAVGDVRPFRDVMDDDFDTPAAVAVHLRARARRERRDRRGSVGDGRDVLRDRARAGRCARDRGENRGARGRRRDRRAGRGPRACARARRTGPKPTGSATSSPAAASSSRTRRGAPSGAESEQGFGRARRRPGRGAQSGARAPARGQAAAARGLPVECGNARRDDRRDRGAGRGRPARRRPRTGRADGAHRRRTRVVVAMAPALRPADLDALLAVDRAFLVAVDGVTDPRNLGAIMRSAETAGATGIILPRHRSASVTPVVAKAAAGAIEYLPIALVGGIPSALERAARAGCWSVGLDEARRPQPVRSRPRRPTDRLGARLRGQGSRASHARTVRRARADSHGGPPRVAQRVGCGGARVSRGRAPTPSVACLVTPG